MHSKIYYKVTIALAIMLGIGCYWKEFFRLETPLNSEAYFRKEGKYVKKLVIDNNEFYLSMQGYFWRRPTTDDLIIDIKFISKIDHKNIFDLNNFSFQADCLDSTNYEILDARKGKSRLTLFYSPASESLPLKDSLIAAYKQILQIVNCQKTTIKINNIFEHERIIEVSHDPKPLKRMQEEIIKSEG